MHGPITSVADADAVRYERREAEKRGGGQEEQEGHQDPHGLGEKIWYADWLSGPGGPRGPRSPIGPRSPRSPRPSAACRVNLSAAFGAVEADRREEVEADRREEVETEWSAHPNVVLRLDS
jgi:hypothetical protein